MNKIRTLIVLCLGFTSLLAQEIPVPAPAQPTVAPRVYDRREEIIYDAKRYRIHNSYLTFGPGYVQSNIRSSLQRCAALDFQFPIRWQHFQVGVMMSGDAFGSNNHISGHFCYGIRREKNHSNFAAFAGASFYTGVQGDTTGSPRFYRGLGLYGCVQVITKLTYDIGIGAELFGEISPVQGLAGLKLIVFFSGAYRGPKKNFNPHVRSENQ